MSFTYEYLPWRGVSKETMAHYDVKTKINEEGKPVSIVYPYGTEASKTRKIDSKDFYSTGDIVKQGLFGKDKFSAGTHKYVTITEGELDALSLYEVLRAPVVSVQSSGTAARDCGSLADRAWLNSHERIYLAFDADEQGRRAVREVSKLFDINKLYLVRFTKRKDANEYLSAGEGEDLRHIWWNSGKYQPDHIISSIAEFRDILSVPPDWGAPYPFDTLTHKTYGIRTSEVVLITAQEGVGKTELMHAIEHRLLTYLREIDDEQGSVRSDTTSSGDTTKRNLGAIYLEEPKRRHLQALAGIELRRPAHLPDSGCSTTEMGDAIERLVAKDGRLKLYSHYGSDDPDALLDTIRYMVAGGQCRFVLLDHITMAVTGLAGEDERRALDYLSHRLEILTKELDFALIVVSHVNDDGKTRGSRYISKVADIRIDLFRDVANEDPIVHVNIAKSRDIGRTGSAGRYVFDQNTRQYTELVSAKQTEKANDNDILGTSSPRRAA